MQEVVTVLEAEVHDGKWALLKQTYEKATAIVPESIKQTFLIQSQLRPKVWRIITHWRSQEDLDKMRSSESVPVAVQIFKAVGASPQLEIWDSTVHHIGPQSR